MDKKESYFIVSTSFYFFLYISIVNGIKIRDWGFILVLEVS